MKFLVFIIVSGSLVGCASKPPENSALYAMKVAKPKEVKSLITPGFY